MIQRTEAEAFDDEAGDVASRSERFQDIDMQLNAVQMLQIDLDFRTPFQV